MSRYNTNNQDQSNEVKDFSDNSQIVDEIVHSQQSTTKDRLKAWPGSQQDANAAIAGFGYITLDSFEDGATLTHPNEVLRYETTGEYYRWDGVLPKTVPVGSTPQTSGGIGLGVWLSIGQTTQSYLVPNVRSLWGEHLEKLGMILVNGSFSEGAAVTAPNQAVWDDFSGLVYARVAGDSVAVAAGSSPDANWTSNIGARIKAWVPNTSPNTDVSTRLQALLTAGKGEIKIPDGRYNVFTGLVTNFSDSSFPSLGAGSPRYNFSGSSINNTIFTVSNNYFLNHTGGVNGSVVQGTNTYMRTGDCQIIGTGATSSGGFKFSFCTFIEVENIRAALLGIPVYFANCIYNYVRNIRIDNSLYGIFTESSDPSFPTNSTFVDDSTFTYCSRYAVESTIGLTFNMTNCSIEKNGVQGNVNTGGIYLKVTAPLSVINITGTYFEANKGNADITVLNSGGGTIVVNLIGCTFNRGNSDGGYTLTNFKSLAQAGVGKIILNLQGCHFFSNTSWGFTPSADKPFITPDTWLTVNGLDTCTFSETTSLPATIQSSSSNISVKVAADGTKISGPSYITTSKTGTGVYSVVSSYPFGTSSVGNDYSAMAISNTDGFVVTSSANQSATSFNVRTKSSAGAAADTAFSVTITRRIG